MSLITVFTLSFVDRNDQLQQEIMLLRERNRNEITSLKKSLDDAIGRWYDNVNEKQYLSL